MNVRTTIDVLSLNINLLIVRLCAVLLVLKTRLILVEWRLPINVCYIHIVVSCDFGMMVEFRMCTCNILKIIV